MTYFLNQMSALERRYNGPIPAEALPRRPLLKGGHLLGAHSAHAREALSLRRRGLSGFQVSADERLLDLGELVASYRHAAVGYHCPGS